MTVADKISFIIDTKELNVSKICRDIGMSRTAFYNMLEKNTFKVETLEKIAKILGVDIFYFFTDEKSGVLDLGAYMDTAINDKIHIDIPKIDTTPKTSTNRINSGIYLRSMSTAMVLFELYEDLNNRLEDWENDNNISKDDIVNEIKKLLGEVNYSAKH